MPTRLCLINRGANFAFNLAARAYLPENKRLSAAAGAIDCALQTSVS
jgi:hypothetical protein